METASTIVLRALTSENLALSYLLGMCTFLAMSRRLSTALGLGVAVILVETITVPVNQWLYTTFLESGGLSIGNWQSPDLGYMRILLFIGVIATLVQIVDLIMERFSPALYARLGAFLPLLTVNCAILGASLFMVQRDYNFSQSAAYGFGAGLGWALAIAMFAAIRERLRYSVVPEGLRGLGLAFVVTGLLSLAFSGLTSLEFGA